MLDGKGVIQGSNIELVEIYPRIHGLIDQKVYQLNKELKTIIDHFRYYEIAVVQSLKLKESIYLIGFKPSKVKEYKQTWDRLNEQGDGHLCVLDFGG